MSRSNTAPEQISEPNWLTLRQVAGTVAAITANAIASTVMRRAASQAHRELAALDDRTLADIGLVRPELTSLLESLAETRTAAVLAQFPWNRPRIGA